MADRVVFVGRVAHDEVAVYLRAADVFVLNTQYEGLSHTLVEVRHVGAPIVTTDIGGNREILRHEQNALLVPYGDHDAFITAVNRVLNDRALADRLVANGRQGLEHFQWERLVEETLDLLHEVTRIPRREARTQA